jgi:hypothetical protein
VSTQPIRPEGSTDATDAEGTAHAHRDLRLFLAPLICLVVCLVLFPTFTVLYVAWEASQVKIYEAQQQALNNHKFCGLVNTLLAPAPPPGPATANPSRAFEQILHSKISDLKKGLAC